MASSSTYIPTPLIPSASPSRASKKRKLKEGEEEPEKRMAIFKKKIPANINERAGRVMSQRFFCVDREKTSDITECFKVLGSTGNVYEVRIAHLPSCSCPDGSKGNHCKHIIFVFLKVLGIPYTSNIWYQKALLTTELVSIFEFARQAPVDRATKRIQSIYKKATAGGGGKVEEEEEDTVLGKKRLPVENDACPICYEDFVAGSTDGLVFCESIKGCGNPVHSECQQQWAFQTKPVTCVYCRTAWEVQPAAGGSAAGSSYSAEGYLNLAASAGISSMRDTSSYYHGIVRRDQVYKRGYLYE